MKIYIAGPITGIPDYKQHFADAEQRLRDAGHVTMNPAVLPEGFTHDEYMHICFAMMDVCQAIYLLDGWQDSKGARMEYEYALKPQKAIMFEGDDNEPTQSLLVTDGRRGIRLPSRKEGEAPGGFEEAD